MNYKIVIPARKGSKRFPKKNLVNFFGRPLIEHTILFALNTHSCNDIWVNTDDPDIAKIALKYNVNICIRPNNLGTDFTTTAEVLKFQCKEFQKLNIKCNAVILLQATNPLRPINLIYDSIMLFELHNRGSLASFSNFKKKIGQIRNHFFYPTNYIPGQRSQDMISEYYENGLIYITKVENILNGMILTDDVFPFIYNGIESSVDIDEVDDLTFAEYVYKKLKK
jgi:N-acylneuraminate cytidylyltransferase